MLLEPLEPIRIKHGDAGRTIDHQLVDDDGNPVPLSGPTPTVILHCKGPVNFDASSVIILDPNLATVRATFSAANLLSPIGWYSCEYQATWSATRVETFPSNGFFQLEIVEEAA